MNTFIDYLIKSTLILSVLYSLYWLLMRKDTHFAFNRAVLLFILLISLLMPLINFDFLKRPDPLATLPAFTIDMDAMVANSGYSKVTKAFDWKRLVLIFYGAGAMVVLIRLVTQGIYLYAVSRLSKVIGTGKIKIVLMNAEITPFVYFNRVYVPASRFNESSMDAILRHEQSHLEQLHYVDIFILQILTIVHWFNPIAWLFEKSLKEIHEYLADESVLQHGLDQGTYQALLVNEALGGPVFTITNQFNKSLIKNRIIMMTKMKTPRLAQLKVFLFVPACAFFLLAFAAPNMPNFNRQKSLESSNISAKLNSDKNTVEIKSDTVAFAEQMPNFPGGVQGLMKYLADSIRYPDKAKELGISGRVIIQFIVTDEGNISNVKVLQGIGGGCDEEAVRVVKEMPRWKPGFQDGKPVNVYFTLPILYSFKEDKKEHK